MGGPRLRADGAEQPLPPKSGVTSGLALNSLLWVLFVALSTLTQLCFKLASKPLEQLEFGRRWLEVAASTPAFVIASGSYGLTFAIWIVILQRMALSKAFLLTALVNVTVTLGSGVWLGDRKSVV